MIDAQDPLSIERIRRAKATIAPVFLDSPQYVHEGLSARAGIPVIVKVETVNPIRSFKGRGTWVALHALAEQGRVGPDRAVVVASAGNFGQGVAYAARALGVPAVVFTSRHANRAKIARRGGRGGHLGRARGDPATGWRSAPDHHRQQHLTPRSPLGPDGHRVSPHRPVQRPGPGARQRLRPRTLVRALSSAWLPGTTRPDVSEY